MTAENIFTNNEWFEAQRKFWDGWMQIARESTEKLVVFWNASIREGCGTTGLPQRGLRVTDTVGIPRGRRIFR